MNPESRLHSSNVVASDEYEGSGCDVDRNDLFRESLNCNLSLVSLTGNHQRRLKCIRADVVA